MPFSFICFRIWSCHVLDDSCVMVVVGWHRWVLVSGLWGKVALGRRVPPSLLAPLRPARPRRRMVPGHLPLLPVALLCLSSRPRRRSSRRRRSLLLSRRVRPWRPPRPRSPALRRSIRTNRSCSGSATWRVAAFHPLGRDRSSAEEPAGGRGGPWHRRGGGAFGEGCYHGRPSPCLPQTSKSVPLVSSILGHVSNPLFSQHFTILIRSAGGGVGHRSP